MPSVARDCRLFNCRFELAPIDLPLLLTSDAPLREGVHRMPVEGGDRTTVDLCEVPNETSAVSYCHHALHDEDFRTPPVLNGVADGADGIDPHQGRYAAAGFFRKLPDFMTVKPLPASAY